MHFFFVPTLIAAAFLLSNALAFSQNSNCPPPTFIKTWGNATRQEFGTVLTHSSDGNLYLAGTAGNKTFIQKINFAGDPVWMREFEISPLKPVTPVQIFEDSEGMIVGCGAQQPGPTGKRGIVFRYNPIADSFLWAQVIESPAPITAGILEKTPGGNFIFYQNPNTGFDIMFLDYEIEILELDRTTGNIVPGLAKRYEYIYLDKLQKMVAANGSLYGFGSSTCRHDFGYKSNRLLLARFDPTDGTPLWAQLSHADTSTVADFSPLDLVVDGDALLAAYTMTEDASNWPGNTPPYNVHLQKTDLDGNILWIRKYELNTSFLHILVVSDGYVLSAQHVVIKVNKNGDFLWGRRLPYIMLGVNEFYQASLQAAIEADSLYLIGQTHTENGAFKNMDVLFWKMFADGSMSDPCSLIHSFNLQPIDVQNPVRTPITLEHFASTAVAMAVNTPWTPNIMEEKLLCPIYTPMSMACPADIEVATIPGAGGAPVNYKLPSATSDCQCPDISFTRTDGLSAGSLFPVGNTQICYSAQDDCGISASCCFQVKVREELPCDTKTIGCLEYELLSITADAQQRYTYRIRVTNNCANKLIYTAIQLPDGVAALSPVNLSTFTSPEGHNYGVRNPNYSPFYSIRFKSDADGISNGESDVLEYSLPAQSHPAYIHIISRLEPQLVYAAHLNTFNCPIGATPIQNRSESPTLFGNTQTGILLFPNPTNGELFADLSHWKGENLDIQIMDCRGQRVQSFNLTASSEAQVISWSGQLPTGLYFFEVASRHGERVVSKFMLTGGR